MRKLLFALLFLTVLGLSYIYYINTKDNLKKSIIPTSILKRSRVSNVFKIEKDKYISFTLSNLADEIRIATNAEFSENIDLRQSSNREVYTIEAAAYNRNGDLIEKRYINYATKAQFYFSKNYGMYLPSYFLDSENLPGETRVGRLNFKNSENIAEIRLKRIDENPNLINIFARIYQKAQISEGKLNFYWLNLIKQDRRRIASANLYPVDMLLKSEKANLMRNLWTLVTPNGVPNKDYEAKKLYNINKPIGIPYDINLLHSGNYIDDLHSIIIPINEDESDINVNIISADIIYPKYMKIWLVQPNDNIANILKLMRQEEGSLNITEKNLQFIQGQKAEIIWRGRGLDQTKKYEININDRNFSRNYKFNAGSLVINSNSPAYVNVSKKTGDEFKRIHAEPSGTTLIGLKPGSFVEYEVFHDNFNKYSSFRLDLRVISPKFFSGQDESQVNYELLDAEGAILEKSTVRFPQLPTKFDFTVTKQGLHISGRTKYYFLLPKNISKIRFSGEDNIFIGFYDRLDSFERKYIIPDDYKISQDKGETLRRTWFYKEPTGFDRLKTDLRTIFVKSQNDVSKENELVKAGIFNWKEILPSSQNWKAVEITEKKSSAIASRAEASSSEFSPIPINQDYEVEFEGTLSKRVISPVLVYIGKFGTKIKVFLNNNLLLDTALLTTNGKINLPNIPVGKYALRVTANESAKVFLNYLKKDEKSFIKHNVVRFDSRKLDFVFEKPSEDNSVITLKTYSTSQNVKTLSVQILPIDLNYIRLLKPLQSYTIKTRIYEIKFTKPEEETVFVDNKQSALYRSDGMYIKLGSDLKKGKYIIRLTCEDFGGFYASLTSITPGSVDDKTISTEVEDET